MSAEFDRENLVSIFVLEASDGMEVLTKALYPADASLPTHQKILEQSIVAHRIRGAAALYGFDGIARLCKRLETIFEQTMSIPDAEWPRAVGAMRETVQGIQTLVRAIGIGRSEDLAIIERCLASSVGLVAEEPSQPVLLPIAASMSQECLEPSIDVGVLSHVGPEANECLDVIDGVICALRPNTEDQEGTLRILCAVQTLRRLARTPGFQLVGDIADAMEDCMNAVREQRIAMSSELLGAVSGAAGLVRMLLGRDVSAGERVETEAPAVICLLNQLRDGQVIVSSADTNPALSTTQDDTAVSIVAEPAAGAAAETIEQPRHLSDDYFLPQVDQEVLSYFLPEAQEYLETLEANLLRLDKDTRNPELINQLFRTAHTLKGSAYTVGFQAIGDLVHHVEDFMGAVRDCRFSVLPGHTDLILRVVDVVRVLMRRDPGILHVTKRRFQEALFELKQLEHGPAIEETSAYQPIGVPIAQEENQPGLAEDQGQAGKQPEDKTGEEREVIRVSYARLEQLMNLVGEVVIGRGRLEQRLRALERLSDQVLACKTRLVDSIQTFADKHTFTFQSAPTSPSVSLPQRGRGFGDFGDLELDKYDDFNILARRIGEVTADITESMAQLNRSIRRAQDDMNQLQELTRNMRDEIGRARMVPVGTPFTRFRRAIREIARASNKEVSLVTSGEHTEVDTGVVERLVDPLVHLVRNAVYHGIEPPADRAAKGKPAAGTIYLHAAHRGNSVIIEVEDDGAGLDLEKIREKAVAVRLAQPDQILAMSDAEVLQYIFEPGFSTADKIGDQAGRGVGLDVVKRGVEAMNGRIEVESLPDVGTKFTLHLPLTLLITAALLVRAGAEQYAIALSNIREVTLSTAASLTWTEGHTLLHLDEEVIEVRSLRTMLRRQASRVEGEMPILIVRTAAGLLGLAVDELLGRQEIVIKSLGSLKPFEDSFFGGATIDPEGRVILVVDPSRLGSRQSAQSAARSTPSATAHQTEGLMTPERSGNAGAAILLVDDSLSIRKFVGKMLESAGYSVETAVDGEDGLRKASETAYGLIITDLEMPKFNGYEVVQALRGRPQTQQTPIVVMTTRAGNKHRQLAIEIGANSYIAKPVEERTLIQEVERWLGPTAVNSK
jgi:chemosensory pili system protein ChpA (sensor histidine kinase/response regulator)